MEISQSGVKYFLYWSSGGGQPPAEPNDSAFTEIAEIGFGSNQQAELFLRRLGRLHELRSLLRERFPGQAGSQWRESEVMNKLASCMVRGELKAVKRWPKPTGTVSSTSGPAVVARRQAVEFPDHVAEGSTFGPNHDGEAQAAALRTAAEDGAAICEECERRRQQEAAAAAH